MGVWRNVHLKEVGIGPPEMYEEQPQSPKLRKEAAAWTREAHILNKRFEVATMESRSIFRTKTDLRKDLTQLLDTKNKQDEALHKEKEKTRKDITTCQDGVYQIKCMLEGMENGELPVGNLQQTVEKLDDALRAFKARMREEYDQLIGEERLLSKDLSLAAARFDAWEKVKDEVILDALPTKKAKLRPQSRGHGRPTTTTGPEGSGGSSRASELRDLVDIVNHQIEMEGGPTGGWHPKEHDKFLRLWTQVNGNADVNMEGDEKPAKINQLVTKATVSLPGRSSEEVVEHFNWYKGYLKNVEKKKKLVDEWKKEKNKKEYERVMKEIAEAEINEDVHLKEAQTRTTKQYKTTEEEQRQKRLQVQAWKHEKKKKQEEEAAAKAKLEAERKEREIQERARQRHQKERVMAFRLEKEMEKKRVEEAQRLLTPQPRCNPTKKGDDRVARELEKAAERRRAAEQKAWEQSGGVRREKVQAAARHVPRQRSASASARATRDPDRLTRGTASSRQKAYTPEELDKRDEAKAKAGAHDDHIAYGARDLNFVGRVVPAWRQML